MITARSPSNLVVAAAAAALAPLVGATQPAPDSPPAGDSIAVLIVDQSFAVRSGGSLSLTVALTGVAEAQLADATFTVTVYDAVIDVAGLTAVDAGELPPPTAAVAAPADQIAVVDSTDSSLTVELSLPAGDVDLSSTGVHPVTVDVAVDGETASATTFIVVVEEGTPPAALELSILVAIDSPGPWPSSGDRSRLAEEVAGLVELAEAVDGPLSIDLPAGVVAALTAPAPPDLDSLMPNSLAGAFRGDELIAGPATPLDPSAVAAVDLAGLFTRQLRDGEDLVSMASPRAIISRAVWIADQPLSAPGAALLRDLGVRMLVITEEVAAGLGDGDQPELFEVDLGGTGTLPAMSISPLGTYLEPTAAGDPNGRAVRLAAEALLHRDSTGTPAIVLATPGLGLPDPATTARLAELLSEVPGAALVPISRLSGSLDGSTGTQRPPPLVLPERAGTDLAERVARIGEVRDDATHATSMLVDLSPVSAWQAELDALLSATLDDAGAQRRLDTIATEIDGVLDAVVPPEPFTFTTTGTSSTLRLRLDNTAEVPVEVVVHPRSTKLRFPEPRLLVEIPALGSQVVEIPVEARSNGTFTIEVDLLTPDGYQIGGPVVVTARVSRITGLSQVLTGGAVLVLASWWFSHLRRNRRRRDGGGDDSTFDVEAEGASRPGAMSPDAIAAGPSVPPSSSPPPQ